MCSRVIFASLITFSLFGQKPPDFQREIRPILSDNCFQCHGPDSKTRMAGVRLDRKEDMMRVKDRIYVRVSAPDAAKRMPPEYSHKKLTPAQIASIKRWTDAGAPWQEHWAFTAPVKPANATIDSLVLAKLRTVGLTAAPQADPRTLIRRVSLDLTGLPPTPAEIQAFLKDTTPGAYERMVDRYLASPRYGEHRARYWLDAARYADTHGIHVDNYREMWPYRDWVIQAFNRNLHFDQFTIEQLAGDLLPNPTLDQRIATGFHRCNVTTNEAGIIEDEYAEIYAKDRADTTGAVWLGMTVGCATCHDHKFDPISQKDFYSLGAFFRNTVQKVMDDNIPDTPPVMVVPKPEDRDDWARVNTRLNAIKSEMKTARESSSQSFETWLASRSKPLVNTPLSGELFAAPRALEFEKNEGVEFPNAPKLDAEKPFSISVSFFFPEAEQSYVIAAQQDTKDKNRGWVIDVGARVVGVRLYGDDGKNIEIRAAHLEQIKHGTWNHVAVSYDGSRHQSGLNLYLNGRAIHTQGRGNQNVQLPGSIGVSNPLVLGRSLAKGSITDFRIFDRVISESEATLLNDWPEIRKGNKDALLTWFLLKEYKPFQKLAAEQTELNLEARGIARRGSVTHVMQERTDSMPTANILFRGAYDQKRAKVEANTPAVLPPMSADLPRNRLGFAKWLFTEDHPLTSRVTVNRMWQEIFGTGLVKTVDDFGSQGEAPANQELLDWLAVDFREHNWDIKRFYKQILLSSTYKQAALTTADKLAKDPENRLLSRGPRFRMDAETVRDYALAASGLMAPQIGGPSVKPYQPDGVWEAVAMIGSNTRFYKRDAGDALYRRSLYWFWKRSAPPATLDIFNAPSREFCTVRRERTNTPLQALATMNDVQFVEAAKALAQRSMEEEAVLDDRLDYTALRVMARPLTAPEKTIVRKSYESFRKHYEANPTDAEKLLDAGERKSNPGLPQADLAALTMVANELLNLDEVLNK